MKLTDKEFKKIMDSGKVLTQVQFDDMAETITEKYRNSVPLTYSEETFEQICRVKYNEILAKRGESK